MLQNRPPIIVILGHVDHGKTTLLDYLRKSSVAAREAGGITQHIRSFQLNGITFIDTPGHEAFAAMRSRGSKIADIAVLVVSATDGVMPQTKESIEFIKSAQVPFIVALNKSDLTDANPDRVKTQLTEVGVVVEDFGGDVPAVSIYAKTGKGIPELLELLGLLASLNPPQADPNAQVEAIVLESHLDSKKGPLATVIVKNGTLKVGNGIRALINPDGQNIKEALPSVPVEILGLSSVPEVGSVIGSNIPSPKLGEGRKGEVHKKEGGLNLILHADVAGSLEAIINSLPNEINVLQSSTGDLVETDVDLARTNKAIIIGFNVKVSASVAKLAEVDHVVIYSYKIIYELLDELSKLTAPKAAEVVSGRAQISAEFKINADRVAGCACTEGVISKSSKIRVLRGSQVVGETKLKSLKSGKSDLQSIKSGTEFGAVFSPYVDFKIGDTIIALS